MATPIPTTGATSADQLPDSIFTWVFQASTGDSWGGWLVEDSARYVAGDTIFTAHGHYLITTEEERGTDLSPLGLAEGQVRVEWYRDSTGPFLATRAGPGVPVGLAGLGSELDAAWDGAAWVNFGRGGADQVGSPALALFTWVFEANSGDRLHGTLVAEALSYGTGDTFATPFGSYQITAKAALPAEANPGAAAGEIRTTRYFDATVGRDLPVESGGIGVTGTAGLGSEIDRVWNDTAWAPVGQGGGLQADGQGFSSLRKLISQFGAEAGNWTSYDRYPRQLADMNGDGLADIVGFGDSGAWVSTQNADGSFSGLRKLISQFGAEAGGWTSFDRHPRQLADMSGDGLADIVGFGDSGAWVSTQNADGSFSGLRLLIRQFGAEAGGWTSFDRHPRQLADMNGDGLADIVGFGDSGAWVSTQNADGSFSGLRLLIRQFGAEAGNWTSFDRHPRLLADMNGDGLADIVGFGDSGAWVSTQNADGSFSGLRLLIRQFGAEAGGWTSFDRHPRQLADVNGDGRTDIIGFGDSGVWASLQNADGTFGGLRLLIRQFGAEAGAWTGQDSFPRQMADMNGDGRADVVGFGNSGVWSSLAPSGDGIFGL
ncbi:FG-GAP repeat domain-containing protein [Falsiroseomonas sp.]|uniref:FG-GAP repeat domain-containing protein n=1 Tax=Falsiroseomonas sp. TaxID=2870721 RepID=UPI00356370BC